MRNRLMVATVFTVAVIAVPFAQAAEEITQQDVDTALASRRAISASLEASAARFDAAIEDEIITRESIVSLSKSVSLLERTIGTTRAELKDIVLSRYMSSGSSGGSRMFSARTFAELNVQYEYYARVNEMDLARLRELEADEARYHDEQAALDESLVKQQALVLEIGELTEQILTTLEKANNEYNSIAAAFQVQEEKRRIREEEERKAAELAAWLATSTTVTVPQSTTAPSTTTTTASSSTTTSTGTTTTTQPPPPPPVITDGKTCPVNGATAFSDTWGARRSGGRTHKGVDMMSARGTPLVAIESGVITRTSNSSLGGISIYLTGASGSQYYYAHLDALAGGATAGLSVAVGDLIGTVGSTGNASYSAPHLHFQYAPAGSDWINPYPLVKALCG